MSKQRSPLEIEAGSSALCTVLFCAVGTEKGDAYYRVSEQGSSLSVTDKKGTGNASPSLLALGGCVLMSST